MFSKVLIANRGEIAVRIARTCRELGVATVAVHSDVDANAKHVRSCDEAVHLPGVSPVDTYLRIDAIVDAARRTGAEAVHPGYGFVSERVEAARGIADAGLVWIGPPPDAIEAAGDKIRARRLAESAGVSAVPGTLDPVADAEEVLAFGERHGYPLAIKAAGGGGGRGLKVAATAGDVASAFESAVREATAYFGYGDVYVERYLPRPKHVEVQVLAPRPGEAISLGARDCSLQRRHQKLVEETPPPLFPDVVPAMGEAGVAVANRCGYVNAGTVEFLLDTDDGSFYFLEINARLQVEHTITEVVLGVDLVAEQLRIASGDPLGFDPSGLEPRGHAVELRINAEDPARDFLPKPGRITRYREPTGAGVRVDSGFGEGDELPAAYDSLIAKLIVSGADREEARTRAIAALEAYAVEGIATTIPAHLALLRHPSFVDGTYTTRTVQEGALDALKDRPAPAAGTLVVEGKPVRLWHPAIAAAVSAAGTAAAGHVVAPMHGTILKVLVEQGDEVAAGDPVAVLEAMKMETQLAATVAGVVKEVLVEPGAVVGAGDAVAVIS